MFERFSRELRCAVLEAEGEARRRHDPQVGSEHLLLGVAGMEGSRGNGSLGVTLEALRAALESMDSEALAWVGIGAETEQLLEELDPLPPSRGHLRFSHGARETLQRTLREALLLGHRQLISEHLLLAITTAPATDPALCLLRRVGLEPSEMRSRILALMQASA